MPIGGMLQTAVASVEIYALLEDEIFEPGVEWVTISLEPGGEALAALSVEGFRSSTNPDWRDREFSFGNPEIPNLYTISAKNFRAMCDDLGL